MPSMERDSNPDCVGHSSPLWPQCNESLVTVIGNTDETIMTWTKLQLLKVLRARGYSNLDFRSGGLCLSHYAKSLLEWNDEKRLI